MTTIRPVLVLGGSGFIGRHVVTALAAARHPVHAPRRAELDLTVAAPRLLADLLHAVRPRAVVNAVGAVWGGGPDRMHALNVEVPHRLAAALHAHPEPVHLIHLGSSVEYGPTPAGRPIPESVPARPRGAYAETKLAATAHLLTTARPAVTVLRVFNAIGPGQPVESLLGGVAARLAAAGADEVVPVAVSPLQDSRDFVDVRDVAQAVRHAVDRGPLGRAVNVGAGTPHRVDDVMRRLIRITGRRATVTEQPVGAPARSGGIRWQCADLSVARRLLGWQPRLDLDTTLGDLWHHACGAQPRLSHPTSGGDDGFRDQSAGPGPGPPVPPVGAGGTLRTG